jgi:16S rRNA (guanine527-N7)-methyltransferase
MNGPHGTATLREVLEQARSLDLLGPMALDKQVDHALGFADAWEQARPGEPTPGRWLDLGSGGGLPGLVLAQHWPDTPAVLLDAAERRTTFLSEAVRRLGWSDRVQVVRARAEEAGRSGSELRTGFDVVWARSFGSPPVTAESAAPFLKPDGLLVVSEPPDPGQAATRWPQEGLALLGQEALLTVRGRFGYQVIRQTALCPERFPRRSGVAAKRPLYRLSEG